MCLLNIKFGMGSQNTGRLVPSITPSHFFRCGVSIVLHLVTGVSVGVYWNHLFCGNSLDPAYGQEATKGEDWLHETMLLAIGRVIEVLCLHVNSRCLQGDMLHRVTQRQQGRPYQWGVTTMASWSQSPICSQSELHCLKVTAFGNKQFSWLDEIVRPHIDNGGICVLMVPWWLQEDYFGSICANWRVSIHPWQRKVHITRCCAAKQQMKLKLFACQTRQDNL